MTLQSDPQSLPAALHSGVTAITVNIRRFAPWKKGPDDLTKQTRTTAGLTVVKVSSSQDKLCPGRDLCFLGTADEKRERLWENRTGGNSKTAPREVMF